MGNKSIVRDAYVWLWKATCRGMWRLGYGKAWMMNYIDEIK